MLIKQAFVKQATFAFVVNDIELSPAPLYSVHWLIELSLLIIACQVD